MGRHLDTYDEVGPRRVIGILLVVASVALLGFGLVRSGFIEGARTVLGLAGSGSAATGAAAANADGCSYRPLRVWVAPEAEPVVKARLEQVTREDNCARFEVTPTKSVVALEKVGKNEQPDIWVPETSAWTDLLPQGQGDWTDGGSVMSSPVVIAAPLSGSSMLTKTPTSWIELINKTGGIRMSNPDRDAASRLAYFASRVGQPEELNIEVGARLIFTSRFARAAVEDLFQSAREGGDVRPFPASEQQLAAFDQEKSGLLKRVVPTEGTPSFDYPWLTPPALPANLKTVADLGLRGMQTSAATDAITAAGFRTATNAQGPTINGEAATALTITPTSALMDRTKRLGAIEQWDVLRTDTRLLAVIDVSGSMRAEAKGSGGMSRAKVAENALLTAVRVIPGGSHVGGWIFSSNQDGKGQDWREMAPVQKLDGAAPDGKTSYRQYLLDLIQTMPKYIKGDTGLYDTAYAAFKQMQSTYDPKFVNSVAILTDGKNDDSTGGLSLEQLLDKFKKEYDPQRPVRIICIGMGEADPAALNAISKATGGTSYIANAPKDIETVFVKALLARSTKEGVRL